jgi:hypothetical protein
MKSAMHLLFPKFSSRTIAEPQKMRIAEAIFTSRYKKSIHISSGKNLSFNALIYTSITCVFCACMTGKLKSVSQETG